MKQIKYLSIRRENLAEYVNRALIVPAKYIEQRTVSDQQSYCDAMLFLTDRPKYFGQDDCCLKIGLTEEDCHQLKNVEEGCFLSEPLPLTRIKKIFFISEKAYETTKHNIESGVGFLDLDKKDIVIHDKDTANALRQDSYIKINLNNSYIHEDKSIYKNIKMFDKTLGAYAFIKMSNPLYLCRSPYAVSFYQAFREKKLEKCQELEIDDEIKKECISKKIDLDFFREKVKEKELKVEDIISSFGIIDHDMLVDHKDLYIYSFIANYGEGKRKKTEDLVQMIRQSNKIRWPELITFYYGLHEGYRKLRNQYGITCKKSVKIRLSDRIDCLMVESVYSKMFKREMFSDVIKSSANIFPFYRTESFGDVEDICCGLKKDVSVETWESWWNARFNRDEKAMGRDMYCYISGIIEYYESRIEEIKKQDSEENGLNKNFFDALMVFAENMEMPGKRYKKENIKNSLENLIVGVGDSKMKKVLKNKLETVNRSLQKNKQKNAPLLVEE